MEIFGLLLALLWALFKLAADITAVVIFGGLALGVLELRQSDQFRRARAGWRAGRGKR